MCGPVVAVEAVERGNYYVGEAHGERAPDGQRPAAYSVDDEEGCHYSDELADVKSAGEDQG